MHCRFLVRADCSKLVTTPPQAVWKSSSIVYRSIYLCFFHPSCPRLCSSLPSRLRAQLTAATAPVCRCNLHITYSGPLPRALTCPPGLSRRWKALGNAGATLVEQSRQSAIPNEEYLPGQLEQPACSLPSSLPFSPFPFADCDPQWGCHAVAPFGSSMTSLPAFSASKFCGEKPRNQQRPDAHGAFAATSRSSFH